MLNMKWKIIFFKKIIMGGIMVIEMCNLLIANLLWRVSESLG